MPRISCLLASSLAIGWIAAAPIAHAQVTAGDSIPPDAAPGADSRAPSASTVAERARVTAVGGRRVVGWVRSADDTLLVLQPDRRPYELWARRRRTYDRRQLARLELSERPERRGQATVLGVVIGAAVGAAIGSAVLDDDCPSGSQIDCNGGAIGLFFGGSIGGGLGGLLGRHVIGRDRWREVPPAGPLPAR